MTIDEELIVGLKRAKSKLFDKVSIINKISIINQHLIRNKITQANFIINLYERSVLKRLTEHERDIAKRIIEEANKK